MRIAENITIFIFYFLQSFLTEIRNSRHINSDLIMQGHWHWKMGKDTDFSYFNYFQISVTAQILSFLLLPMYLVKICNLVTGIGGERKKIRCWEWD